MSISLGIIGCGAVVQNNYAYALGMYHDVSVKYIFDIQKNLATEVSNLFGAEVVDKEFLIANSDIIIIATPPSTHYELVKECALPEKKIICEKPFVGTAKECYDLIDVVKKSNTELFVPHFRRCYPSAILARSVVSSGVLGAVKSIEVYEGGRFSWKTQSGYVYRDPYGGVLFDTGSHTIDMALYIANLDTVVLNPEVVSVKKDKVEPSHDIEAQLKLQTLQDQQISFKLKLSRKLLLANKIRVTCENGYLDIPTNMANFIRMYGPNGSTVLYSNKSYNNLMDCFAIQFKEMFYNKPNSFFEASRFINLTKILEKVATK